MWRRAGGHYFPVEKIVAMREADGRKEYLVFWEGYPREASTWEEPVNMNCLDKLYVSFIRA